MRTMDDVVGALRAGAAALAHPSHAAVATQGGLSFVPDKASIRVEHEAGRLHLKVLEKLLPLQINDQPGF